MDTGKVVYELLATDMNKHIFDKNKGKDAPFRNN